MNLIQRMVAENWQSVTSQELAKAAGMTHEELCKLFDEEREGMEKNGPVQGNPQAGYVLTINQAFGLVIFMEMSDEFYKEGKATSADELKMDLKDSFIKVLDTLLNAEARITGKKRNLVQEYFEQTGIDMNKVMEDEING